MKREHDANMVQAWVSARLPYLKNPKLSDFLSAGKPRSKIQTPEQQQSAIESLILGFGGTRAQLDAMQKKASD